MQDCVFCDGTGRILRSGTLSELSYMDCLLCDGTGEVPDQKPGDPTDRVHVSKTAPRFSGTK